MSSASTSVFAPSANARLWPEDARPLAHLLSNWARRTRDQLMELLETSAPPANAATATSAAVAQEEYARREKLFHWLTLRQRQLGQLYALLHWTMQNHGALQRVQEITQLLQRRQQMMWTTTDMLSIIHKRAEDSLYPMWDVFTAVHVLSSGTYRLLPQVVESRLVEHYHASSLMSGGGGGDASQLASSRENPLKPPLTDTIIANTLARLNTLLHIKLLCTPLPAALSSVDIRDGLAYLTFNDEVEIGVSLRMGPAVNPPADDDGHAPFNLPEHAAAAAAEAEEEKRISWCLFSLRVLMNIDSASQSLDLPSSAPQAPLLSDKQINYLIVLLNHKSFERPNALLIYYDTLHELLMSVALDILHQQALQLTRGGGMHDTLVEYSQGKTLNVLYWRDLTDMPVEGAASAATQMRPTTTTTTMPSATSRVLAPCLQVHLDERQRLSVRHNPPLMPCESVPDLLRFQLNALSLPQLLSNVLRHHGNQRLQQLFVQLQRDAEDKSRSIVAVMEMEMTEMGGRSSSSSVDCTAASARGVTGVVPRHCLLVRLLAGFAVSISVDLQTGRFVLSLTGVDATRSPRADVSALHTAASSPLLRLLHTESLRMNQNIAGAFDSLLHLRLVCLTLHLSSLCSQLLPASSGARILPLHVPFSARAAPSSPSAVAIAEAARHVVYDPLQGASNGLTGGGWITRPGFGPYTLTIQLASSSGPHFLLFQLNPYAQLSPKCFLVSVMPEPSHRRFGSLPSLPLLHDLRVLPWTASALADHQGGLEDPSEGFCGVRHRAAVSALLAQVTTMLPLCSIQRELRTSFAHLLSAVHLHGLDTPPQMDFPPYLATLPISLQSILQSGATSPLAHLAVEVPFPLTASMRHPASTSMETQLLPEGLRIPQHGQLVIVANDAASSTKRRAGGFTAYFVHPLVSHLLSTLRSSDAAAAHSSSWRSFGHSAIHGGELLHATDNGRHVGVIDDVVTLVYDSISAADVARLVFDLDNLYAHLSWLSHFLHHVQPSTATVPSSAADSAAAATHDEVVEYDHATGGVAALRTSVSRRTGAPAAGSTSTSSITFPSSFFRLTELSCDRMTFAYAHPNGASSATGEPALCTLQLKVRARDGWQRVITQPERLYSSLAKNNSSSGGGKSVIDVVDHTLRQLPVAWPQLPFLELELNRSRGGPSSVLLLLQHVWLASASMGPVCRFVSSVHRWQAMGGLHSLATLRHQPSPALLHCVAESATRVRLLFGAQALSATTAGALMWRNKTDLRFIYEHEVVHDFHAGQPIGKAAAGDGATAASTGDFDATVAAAAHAAAAPDAADGARIKPGKIAGDVSDFLYRWYRNVFKAELQRVWPQLRSRHSLPLVGLRVTQTAGSDCDLSTPVIRIVANPAANSPPRNSNQSSPPSSAIASQPPLVLTPAELHCVEIYFAQRILAPPFQPDPCAAFAKIFALPSAAAGSTAVVQQGANGVLNTANNNSSSVVGTDALADACEAARSLIHLWSLELLQPRPFPQAHCMATPNRELLESLLPAVADATPAPLSFRLVMLLQPALEIDTQEHLLTFAIECAEAPASWQQQQQPHDGDSERICEPPTRLLLLPLAWDLRQKRVGRWESHPKQPQQRVFRAMSAAPSPFASLADAVRALMRCTLAQLLD